MIYLWDVTLSMQGKSKGCPDIWDEVKTAICNDIKRMNDESTEVIILPFQHRAIVESMVKDKATFQGKQRLIEYIKGYELPKLWLGSASNGSESKDGNTTMTAIYQPFKYCMDSLLHKDKKNIIEFLQMVEVIFQKMRRILISIFYLKIGVVMQKIWMFACITLH
jgi:hypothetical protein